MNRMMKPVLTALALVVTLALSSCGAGQAGTPTAIPVDVNAVMTSAAATAFVQLTQIAGQASATPAPSSTPIQTASTNTPAPGLQLVTATEGAGGLPVVNTPLAGTPQANVTVPAGLTPGASPSLTPLAPAAPPSTNVDACLNMKFVADMTIPDGTVMTPEQKFNKIWRVQNTGTCTWDEGFGWQIWAGPSMNGYGQKFSSADHSIAPGSTYDIVVEMRAPTAKGTYIAHWQMVSDTGKGFGDLTVSIIVQ